MVEGRVGQRRWGRYGDEEKVTMAGKDVGGSKIKEGRWWKKEKASPFQRGNQRWLGRKFDGGYRLKKVVWRGDGNSEAKPVEGDVVFADGRETAIRK